MDPAKNPNNNYQPNFNPNLHQQQPPNQYSVQNQPLMNNQVGQNQVMQNPNMPLQMYQGQPQFQGNPYQGHPYQGPPMQGNIDYTNQMVQNQQFSARPFIPHREKIMMTQGIFIKQKIDMLEVMTGCERQNKYNIYLKKDGKFKKKGKPLWKAKEKSGCCSRNFLSNDCRPMKLKIQNCTQLDDDPTCITMEKECTCTCLCFNRPVISVYFSEDPNSQKTKLGTIKDNFDCCNFTFNVYDHQGQKVFRVFTTCCQLGIWCMGCCCAPCEKVNFQVFDQSGNQILEIYKRNKNCLKSAFSDADNFAIDFPPQMGWEHRTLLMSTMLFIDYMMFEEKSGVQNSQSY